MLHALRGLDCITVILRLVLGNYVGQHCPCATAASCASSCSSLSTALRGSPAAEEFGLEVLERFLTRLLGALHICFPKARYGLLHFVSLLFLQVAEFIKAVQVLGREAV